jgi:predicted Rdx family selenoprotein
VKAVDARLLRRLSDVNGAIGPVLLLLIEHWNNDADGGLPPTSDLRSLGQDLVDLGRDLITRADEVERIVAEPPADGGGQP